MWARELLAESSKDSQLALAQLLTHERAEDALAEFFRMHVISRYAELVRENTSPDAIEDPLFRVMVRLTYTANDRLHHGVGGGPAGAWALLWSALREAPSADIDDPADYFCAWFHAKQDNLWYPEPYFERFGVFTYWNGSVEVERFPGLTTKIRNASSAAKRLKPTKRGWFRR